MTKLFIKLVLLITLPLIPFMGLTNSSLSDKESTTNYFKATSLDFELQNTEGEEITDSFFNESKLKSENLVEKNFNVVKKGEEDFEYWVYFDHKNGDEELCEEINLTAEKEGDEVFNGSLSEFDLATESATITNSKDEWNFEISHENEDVSLQGKNCEFDLVFEAYKDADTQTGFSDTERLENNIGIAYEPELTASHNESQNEFVFTLSNLSNFTEFDYQLTYDTDTISDGLNDSVDLSGENSKTEEIILGTCSNNNCTYHVNPHNFDLSIELTDIDGDTISLSEQL